MKLILAGSVGLVAWLGWRSLGWPLIHDAPIMHYIAWLVAGGAVPYRDVFDMNMPGVYLIHWAVLCVGGAGDLAWRAFDLGWIAVTSALLYVYCRPAGGRAAAAVAGAVFALYHLSGGAWRAGQRDFLLCPFLLLGALGVARSVESGAALAPLVGAGLALGAGIMIKPQAGAFWIACVVVAGAGAARQGRSAIAGAGATLAAGLAVPAAVLGWLAARGGLGPFVAILTGYVAPLYGRVGRVRIWDALGWYPYSRWIWALWVIIVALALVGSAPTGSGVRKLLAFLGVAYGWLHFHVQGKGWEYHLYPLALFVTALIPFAASRASVIARWPRALALRPRAAVLVLAALVVTLGAKGVDAVDAPWIAAKALRVAVLADELRPLVPPGGTVQVMDVTDGGIHALLGLGVREPTRFIYDFHFFHDEEDPRIRALQSEFVAALETDRPAAIVVWRGGFNRLDYDRLREVPGLLPLLDRAYELVVDRDVYRIYAKRAHS